MKCTSLALAFSLVSATQLHGQVSAEVVPCDSSIAVAPSAGTWRTVRGDGFTFCVPSDWRPVGKGDKNSDANQWRGKSGWIKWGLGEPDQRLVKVQGTVSSSGQDFRPTTTIGENKKMFELVDDHSVQLSSQHIDYKWLTSATWNQPPVWFQGEANDSRSSDLALAIFRTVRFTTQ